MRSSPRALNPISPSGSTAYVANTANACQEAAPKPPSSQQLGTLLVAASSDGFWNRLVLELKTVTVTALEVVELPARSTARARIV